MADESGFADFLHGAAQAISDNFFRAVFDALAAGQATVAGVRDPVLDRARPFYDRGLINSPEDLRKLHDAGFDPDRAGLWASPQPTPRPSPPPLPNPAPPPRAPTPPPPNPGPTPPPPPPTPNPWPSSMYPAPAPPGPPGGPPPLPVANVPATAFPAGMRPILSPTALRPVAPPSRFRAAANRFRAAIPQAAAAGGARGVARAGAAIFGAAFPEVAIPAAVAREFPKMIVDSVRGLHDFAEGLVATNRHLGSYSGLIATEYMRLSLGDYRRNIATAGGAGDSTVALVRAVDEMRDALQPFRVATTNLQNQAGGFGAGLSKGLAEDFVEVANAINKLSGDINNAEQWGKSVADLIAAAIWASPVGAAVQGIEWLLGKWLPGFKDELEALRKKPPAGPPQVGPWDAFIRQEAGPGRMRPLNPPRAPIQK